MRITLDALLVLLANETARSARSGAPSGSDEFERP